MRAATLIMMLVLCGAACGAAPEWTVGKPVPAGSLVERPVPVAIVVRHDRSSSDARGAFEEIAKARFPDVQLVSELPRGAASGMFAHAEGLDAAKVPLATGAALEWSARRLDPSDRAGVAAAKGALALSFVLDPLRKSDLASVCALAHAVAERLGGWLEDGESRELFTHAQWKAERLDSWQGALPFASGHVSVRPFRRGDRAGLEVVGMRRFGLPDLALDGIGEDGANAGASLLLYVAQALVERPAADAGQITVKAAALLHAKARAPRGAAAGAPVLLTVQAPPDATANPRRLLVTPAAGEQAPALVARLLEELAGPAPEVAMPPHQATALEAASARAQARIRELAKVYQAQPPAGAVLLVKAPFATAAGGREWMWVRVTKWEPGKIAGALQNAPSDVPGLVEGSAVTVSDAELFDYQYTAPGAAPEGGQTDRVLDPGAREDE